MKIIALTDYNRRFGSKYFDNPYRSGMDKELLKKYFNNENYDIEFRMIDDRNIFNKNSNDCFVIYTSSEDPGYYYKSYIEDIVLAYELAGAKVIPPYIYLRANNNKVFMDLLQKKYLDSLTNIETHILGTLEDLLQIIDLVEYPQVFKVASGAKSRGVFLAECRSELICLVKKYNSTGKLAFRLKEYARPFKHNGYARESFYRNKFIIQKLIPGLLNDWKVLIFGKKYYVLKRLNRKNDFRASGGGRLIYETELPVGFLDYAESIFNKFDVPHASFDIGYAQNKYYLFESQFVYFGTYTLEKSNFYFEKIDDTWQLKKEKSELEKVYVESIINKISSFPISPSI